MQYELVVEDMVDTFNARINKLLKNGWKLYGQPFVRTGTYSWFCQALTKGGK